MRGTCQDLTDRLEVLKSRFELLKQDDRSRKLDDSLATQRAQLQRDIGDAQRALDACLNHHRVMGYVQQQRRQGLR